MHPRRPVRPKRLNKRGVTGAIFAITTAILIGAAALATEAALWYLGREQAYGVADAAALAGAVASANGGDAESAAIAVAGMNGFGSTQSNNQGAIAGAAGSTVTVVPFNTSVFGPSATEVTINVDFPTFLASLFHAADINVGVQAAAAVFSPGKACLLSLTGDLTLAMGVDGTYGQRCYFASNATDTTAVNVGSSVNLFTRGITTTGDCDGCLGAPTVDPLWGESNPGGTSEYDRPTAAHQLPTINPLAGLVLSMASTYPTSGQILCPAPSTTGPTILVYNDPTVVLDSTTHCPSAPTAVTIIGIMEPTQPDAATQPDTVVSSACGPPPPPSGFTCAYYNMDITLVSSSSSVLSSLPSAVLSSLPSPVPAQVTLQPGAYLLLNASLNIGSGTSVICSDPSNSNNGCTPPTGVTVVQAGVSGATTKDPGNLYIDPAASVSMPASGTADYPSPSSGLLDDVLFFRDPTNLLADSAQAPSVIIAGNAAIPASSTVSPPFSGWGPPFEGIMYFPPPTNGTTNVWYAGNAASSPGGIRPVCSFIIAGTLNIGYPPGVTGSAGNFVGLDAGGCPSTVPVPTVQAVHLIE
jgi:hypothetical protein